MRPHLLLALLLAAPSGCDQRAGGVTPDAGGEPDLAPACRDADKKPGTTCIRDASGVVTDENGAPLGDLVVSLCADLCFFGKTVADGSFTVAANAWIPTESYAVSLHARPDRASYYARVPAPTGDRVRFPAPLVLLPLPSGGPLIDVDSTALQTVTSGDVTLEIAAGTTMFLDPEDVEAGEAGRRLRALAVVEPAKLPFVDAAAPPVALYALAPFELVFSKPARLTLANRASLPAGTVVEFLALRGLIGDTPPAGVLVPVGAGRVSQDGLRVEMDAGVGVKSLTWIAIRKKGST